MLVIADARARRAIAGVMGGADSEVSRRPRDDRLRERVLQAAVGAAHEQAARPEDRGEHALRARRRPAAAGARWSARARCSSRSARARRAAGWSIAIRARRRAARRCSCGASRIAGLLGVDGARRATSSASSSALGLRAARRPSDGWDVTVPTCRVDLLREVDLIEEVARHYGFDRFPPTFPALTAAPPPIDPRIARDRQLRALADGAGLLRGGDVRLHPSAAAAPFAADGDSRADREPAVGEVRRAAAVAAARPRRRGRAQPPPRAARRAAVRDRHPLHAQTRRDAALAFAWTGAGRAEHWSGAPRDVGLLRHEGRRRARLRTALGVDARVQTADRSARSWCAAQAAAVCAAGNDSVGVIGQLPSALVGRLRRAARQDCACLPAEVDLRRRSRDRAARPPTHSLKAVPLPRFRRSMRDISILVDDTLPAAIRSWHHSQPAAPPTLARHARVRSLSGQGHSRRDKSACRCG